MAADLDMDLDNLMKNAEGAAENPEVMPSEEQIKEYIQKLQAQMTARAVTAPGASIPSFVFIIAFILFFSAIGWFSYKLIKSLSDKERKREEKRKLKELKKKK